MTNQLARLDLNRIITGTIDSIAEQTLSDFRAPGTQPPIPIEEFVADAIMQRSGLWGSWKQRRDQDPHFRDYVKLLQGDNRHPNQKDMLKVCRDVRDRFLHDQINVSDFRINVTLQNPGAAVLCEAIEDYQSKLEADLVMDFAALEQEFLDRLNLGILDRFVQNLKVVLVDEYQDTNLLQEQIYFTLASSAIAHDGSISVVGDDDQSLYRFRGATVELFTQFPSRIQEQRGIQTTPIYLNNNYRSTPTIVNWYTKFINLDSAYKQVRAIGKPPLTVARPGSFADYPILGMFRPDLELLARDLAHFIDRVFNGNGVIITKDTQQLLIIKSQSGGAIGDCALLCSSPREYSSGGKPRLPLVLKNELETLQDPIRVFNPRGQEFSEIREVAQLCGLMLECIDPGAHMQKNITKFPPNVPLVFNTWRKVAQGYINSNPTPTSKHKNMLKNFVQTWQTRPPQSSRKWPHEVPLIQLLYKLITWIPALQEDPEGLVYLEVITRTITQSARFISYNATIQRDSPHARYSIEAVLWGIFEPLASGAIDVDEELIEMLPRDRLNVLSIHQVKGLEFPLVIVDVSSDFKRKHWKQAFKRFPKNGSYPHNLEDMLRPFSPIGVPTRLALDRAFDDLIRQYFVAFSRPQDVLLLVGLGQPNNMPNQIPNVATGWTRDQQWQWQGLPNLIYV